MVRALSLGGPACHQHKHENSAASLRRLHVRSPGQAHPPHFQPQQHQEPPHHPCAQSIELAWTTSLPPTAGSCRHNPDHVSVAHECGTKSQSMSTAGQMALLITLTSTPG